MISRSRRAATPPAASAAARPDGRAGVTGDSTAARARHPASTFGATSANKDRREPDRTDRAELAGSRSASTPDSRCPDPTSPTPTPNRHRRPRRQLPTPGSPTGPTSTPAIWPRSGTTAPPRPVAAPTERSGQYGPRSVARYAHPCNARAVARALHHAAAPSRRLPRPANERACPRPRPSTPEIPDTDGSVHGVARSFDRSTRTDRALTPALSPDRRRTAPHHPAAPRDRGETGHAGRRTSTARQSRASRHRPYRIPDPARHPATSTARPTRPAQSTDPRSAYSRDRRSAPPTRQTRKCGG